MSSPIDLAVLARLGRDFERIRASIGASHDLTTRQAQAFCMIGKASLEGEPLTAQDLIRLLGLASQSAHNTIRHFVRAGYVMQRRSDSDARVKHLVLTEQGTSALRRMIGA